MELYLDSAATTYIDEDVKKLYIDLLNNYFGSTGSLHKLGQESLMMETNAKNNIAKLLKVKSNEIMFNSGATEGNNYATKGIALQYKNRGKTLITSKVEHPSVLDCYKQLESDFGFKVIYLDVNEAGVIDLKQLKDYLNDDVILISIMYVNHEVGSIMPIKEIRNMLKNYPKIIFHSDITQAIGKIPIDLNLVDIATMSSHKIHGLKGCGFIYKKEKINFYPIISGNNAYNAMRAGTSNWIGNVCTEKALNKCLSNLAKNYEALKNIQNSIITNLKDIKEVIINTDYQASIPNIINFSLKGYNPEVVIRALSLKGIYVSSRSVCSVRDADKVSSTLYAMKKDIEICKTSIRMSFDELLNEEQIDYFITSLKEVINQTRK